MNNQECAEMFVNAIKEIARKPENLNNLESYLSHHFDVWLEEFAYTPEGLACELRSFAEMDIC